MKPTAVHSPALAGDSPHRSRARGPLGRRVRQIARRLACAAALFLGALASATGQTLLLKGATVHTVSGAILTNGQVLLRDGRIAGVGSTLSAAADRTEDLAGLNLYPGLIAPSCSLGLIEIDAVRATRDLAEVGEYTPEVESWIAVNPDSELIPVARANGITHALVVGSGGVVAGRSGLIALDGWTAEEMTVKSPVALHVFWPGFSLDTRPKEAFADAAQWKSLEDQARERARRLKELTEFFEEARAYGKARAAGAPNGGRLQPVVPAWEAMLPFVRGERPVMIHADDRRQIRSAVSWADTNGYKIILAGARDAAELAGLLAEKKVAVIFERIFNEGNSLGDTRRRDTSRYDVHFATPAVLHQAGVKVIFGEGLGGDAASNLRNLPYAAAQAVAFGLPAAEAIKGLTLYPAEALGVADRLGSIEEGKEATLIALDGDLLDIRSRVRRVWIAGRETSLETRHTRLYEKYRNRPRRR